MAPQMQVQCFAFKDKTAKLERWEFEPAPLQPGDIGAKFAAYSLRLESAHVWGGLNMCSHNLQLQLAFAEAADSVCRDSSDPQRAMPFRHARWQVRMGSHEVPHGTGTRGSALSETPSSSFSQCSTCWICKLCLMLQIVGVVEQLGSAVTHLKKGDTVGFGWNKDCCQHCDACITGNDVSMSLEHSLLCRASCMMCTVHTDLGIDLPVPANHNASIHL